MKCVKLREASSLLFSSSGFDDEYGWIDLFYSSWCLVSVLSLLWRSLMSLVDMDILQGAGFREFCVS